MKPLSSLISILLFSLALRGQNHDYYWPMGSSFFSGENHGRSVIDFNEEPPLIYGEDRELNIDGTMSSYCDSTGNLLLYTNGIRILDGEHNYMEGGDSLNIGPFALSNYEGGYRVPHSHIFIQLPENPNMIYLFHESIDYHDTFGIVANAFLQTKVDLSQNAGLGEVLSKNEILLEGNFGGVSAVKHANGRDWWVFNSVHSENGYNRFLLSPDGLSEVTQIELEPVLPFLYSNGFIVFSPDGTKMARYEVGHGIYFYGFDRCSGELFFNEFVPLGNSTVGAGLSFSPDSRFFYAASAGYIWQFDTWATGIGGTKETVAVYDGHESPFPTKFFLMQLAPDGRIYINSGSSVNAMHAIQYPNKKGEDCEVRQHSVQLPKYNIATMPHFPNYRLGPLDGSPCDTLGLDNMPIAKYRYEEDSTDFLQVEFTDLSYYEPTEWSWDFGGTGTSDEKDPVHVFPGAGEYEVCLTVSNVNGENTFCKTLAFATVATGETELEVGINVFPNPARGRANVILSGNYLPKAGSMVLYDSMGRAHLSQSIYSGMNSVDLEGLSPGIYFYEVKDGGAKLGSGKLVVKR